MKILTIDFDIIMAPSIELYNNLVPNVSWNNLLKSPQLALCKADLVHYNRLTDFLLKLIKKIRKENIIFIENHAQILEYIKENNIELINIDHHHDLGYPLSDNDKIHCGNWVKFLFDNNKIKSYTWINNENSGLLDNSKYKYDYFNLINYDLNNLLDIDKLILCLSKPWVPPEYYNLFYIWHNIISNYYNYNFYIDYTIPY